MRLDDRQPWAYNFLAYAHGFDGDAPRALAALDRYAALLPANDPNPLDSRGDVLMMNGRYEEAAACYRKNLELNPSFMERLSAVKLALAYLYQGKYSLAELAAEACYEKTQGSARALAATALGDIEVGRGRLERAVARYEEAARIYALADPTKARAPFLKAAHVYLEQRQPQALLALARRHTAPWAAGLRGTAHLLLGDEAAGEKEFAGFRSALAPLVGEYLAGQSVDLYRLQAAAYAGQWQEVIGRWPQLPRSFWNLFALDAARAYLAVGNLAEAERHLRFALRAQRTWPSPEQTAFQSFLAYTLAQFYLGQVLERSGRKAEALNAYQEFLVHFESSSARLPQIAEARAALKRLT